MLPIIIVIALVLILLLGGAVLLWVTKLFKIENRTYKKSLSVVIITSIIGSVFWIISRLLGTGGITLLVELLAIVITFLAFHYFYKKYYLTNSMKSLKIYIVFNVFFIIVAIILVMLTRSFFVSPFIISGEAMSPTYVNGDYLFVEKFDTNISRGDVVIAKIASKPGVALIKRVTGLPGETITIANGEVSINGQVLSEPYINGPTPGSVSVTLSQDQYFLLGDNRAQSTDSRDFGPVTKSEITGKIFYKAAHFGN